MKSLLLFLLAFSAAAYEQTRPLKGDEHPQMIADKVIRNGNVVQCTGHVRATVGPFVLYADSGTLHPDTGEVDLRGHVYTMLPGRSDHNLFRYGPRALVTEKEVQLEADHVNLKNAYLQGSGHILIQTDKGRLLGDEISMFLNTADAEVRGNVQKSSGAPMRRIPEMPADIIR